MKVRQQHDSLRRYSPLEEKEEPDKEDDDDSKNPHTHSNNPPVAAVTPGPARLHMISRENEDPQINCNYKGTRGRLLQALPCRIFFLALRSPQSSQTVDPLLIPRGNTSGRETSRQLSSCGWCDVGIELELLAPCSLPCLLPAHPPWRTSVQPAAPAATGTSLPNKKGIWRCDLLKADF